MTALKERVCFSLMSNGILNPTGTHPQCLGECCNRYEECEYSIMFYQNEIAKFQRSHKRKKIDLVG
jgi:hypothetical protein